MIKIRLTYFSFSFLLISICHGQSFHGFGTSTYGGVQNVVFNPAQIVSIPNKIDINLVSVYSILGSDYSTISIKEGIGLSEGFQFRTGRSFPKNDNNFYRNVDLAGPSVMYRHNRDNSFGISTRIRGIFNINNVNGRLLENVDLGFDQEEDFTSSSKNFSGTIHVWSEIGLTYGFKIHRKFYTLEVGATFKYIQGAGNIIFSSDQIDTEYEAESNTLKTEGEILYGASIDFESSNINFKDVTGGYGVDIGFVIQTKYIRLPRAKPLRFGVSLLDFGSVTYKNTVTGVFDLEKTVFASIFEEDDLGRVLNQAYDGTVEIKPQKINLPLSSRFFADLGITETFFVGFESAVSLVGKNKRNSNRIFNYFTLNPRLEKKWISLYSPVSIQQYTGFSWGIGCRIGVVVLGSDSLLTNLISSSRLNDIYAGVRVPIYE